MMRNVYNWDKQEATAFWYVIKDRYGGIEELPTKVRNQVRRSEKTYQSRRVTPEEMAEQGFELFNKSRERFGEGGLTVSHEQWRARCMAGERDFWMTTERETGVPYAFAICREHNGMCDYVSMGVDPNAPKSTYPVYGLLMEMNRYYLEERGLAYVSDGARSITEHSNIQPFLMEKFKFRRAYCDLQVFYRPWLGVAVRLLYPLRRLLPVRRLQAVFAQEAMARGEA